MWQQMLSIAIYAKVAHGLVCGSPGDQRGLMKWDQAKVEGGPRWVISLVGSGITSVVFLVSLKRALTVGEWVSPPSLPGCWVAIIQFLGLLSDWKTSVMDVHVEWVHTDICTRVAVSG